MLDGAQVLKEQDHYQLVLEVKDKDICALKVGYTTQRMFHIYIHVYIREVGFPLLYIFRRKTKSCTQGWQSLSIISTIVLQNSSNDEK